MLTKRCVMCGKEMTGEDELTETCYACQDKSMENFSLISSTLNDVLVELNDDTNISESEKFSRMVAVCESVKFFGDVPKIHIDEADEYLDDTAKLVNSLNSMLLELEEKEVSSKNAWKSYSLIHAIKEYGGTPEIEFYKSKHGSKINI